MTFLLFIACFLIASVAITKTTIYLLAKYLEKKSCTWRVDWRLPPSKEIHFTILPSCTDWQDAEAQFLKINPDARIKRMAIVSHECQLH